MHVLALLGLKLAPSIKHFKKFLWETFLLRMTRNKLGLFRKHFPV